MPNRLYVRNAWVFDLDNTLYPPELNLFSQVNALMTAYVMEELGLPKPEADKLRHDYWRQYGTTLAGLVAEHGIDPVPYLKKVHDITLDHVRPDQDLRAAIVNLPGRKIVYSNGSGPYVERVLAARGLLGVFDAHYGVEHAGYHPKPNREAFETVFNVDALPRETAVMFEDDPRNLKVPHEMGLSTVLVGPDMMTEDHIAYQTNDLTAFLNEVTD
ncbi:pyrimidine 5'-nucleotidase [Qingshengfaniella alkalisoli]|uniref:Pyrimidine 5'-nucleotidase n=1 Tax=Qingshengfaniella alkalisoli TaxID=2599296 RepID=A0A5B8ISC3_9RHOB|nr:pyrimidine 5'-nucleotidase [Qingshengfaniella alkalisoli]QDY69112.1 pyrimidine 5'-nucleotidase [Qingshengfaniella alkalisoli]